MLHINNNCISVIMSYLDHDNILSCVQLCKKMHMIIHKIYPTLLITNAYDAIRCNAVLSFSKIVHNIPERIMYRIFKYIQSPEIAKIAYNHIRSISERVGTVIIKHMLKIGLCDILDGRPPMNYNSLGQLVIYAVWKNDEKSLEYYKQSYIENYDHYLCCGYARAGNHDKFIELLHETSDINLQMLVYNAYAGNNSTIIGLVEDYIRGKKYCREYKNKGICKANTYDREMSIQYDSFEFYIMLKKIACHDNVYQFNYFFKLLIDTPESGIGFQYIEKIVARIIKYNCLNIVKHTNIVEYCDNHSFIWDMIDYIAWVLTYDMCKLLFSMSKNKEYIKKFISESYNNKLITTFI